MNKVASLPYPEATAAAEAAAPALLAWYDRHRRALPWRSAAGAASDPYAVWLSEIMLQQTTVAAVRPYFAAFLDRWPDVRALAAAPLEDVLKAWAGLGYYSRARNLHYCARRVVEAYGGAFPADEKSLRGLPGVGAYTAAAIAAIAFGRRAVVVDGNVERVMARLFGIATPLPQSKPLLRGAMDRVTPAERAGDFAQATMDLGATICTPRKPACSLCPLHGFCHAFREGRQLTLPVKAARKAVPQRGGAVIVARREDGAVLVRQRPATGLFGGMTEFPSTAWSLAFDPEAAPVWPDGLGSVVARPVRIGAVEHGLTHFTLTLQVYVAWSTDVSDMSADSLRWVMPSELATEALPTLMRKVWAKAEALDQPVIAPPGGAQSVMPLGDPSDRRQPSREPDGSRRRRRPLQTARRTLP